MASHSIAHRLLVLESQARDALAQRAHRADARAALLLAGRRWQALAVSAQQLLLDLRRYVCLLLRQCAVLGLLAAVAPFGARSAAARVGRPLAEREPDPPAAATEDAIVSPGAREREADDAPRTGVPASIQQGEVLPARATTSDVVPALFPVPDPRNSVNQQLRALQERNLSGFMRPASGAPPLLPATVAARAQQSWNKGSSRFNHRRR